MASEVAACDPEPVAAGDFGSNVAAAAAEVPHEGMTCSEDPGGAVECQPAHRAAAGPSAARGRVVRVPPGPVQRRGTTSQSTRGLTGARSVVTSAGTVPARSGRVERLRDVSIPWLGGWPGGGSDDELGGQKLRRFCAPPGEEVE